MKELTVLMPCLNEAETLEICILRARKLLETNGIDGEILISDNGSSDGSQEIARQLGARVVDCPVRGYGAALQFGIEHASSIHILMGDSDDSYHFDEAMPLIQKLRDGADVCMGTRLKGTIKHKAMPLLNRYVGNPILTGIGKLFFKTGLSDFHCGMRAFARESILGLNLVTNGMEWASEMVIKSKLAGLKMVEVPITLYKDGRSRAPHLKRWRDGWRHLRFMLLHSPNWLFLLPGFMLLTLGFVAMVALSRGVVEIGRARLDIHTLLVMSFAVILGIQMIFTGIFANVYSHLSGILPYDERFDNFIRRFTLEKLLIVASMVGLAGVVGLIRESWAWYSAGFPELNVGLTMRQLVPSLTMIAVSVQGIFNGFMLSILFLKTRRRS
jgi:glycosyltransferase involved in cell wall biosynthesis